MKNKSPGELWGELTEQEELHAKIFAMQMELVDAERECRDRIDKIIKELAPVVTKETNDSHV